jgi:hypothetical protein
MDGGHEKHSSVYCGRLSLLQVTKFREYTSLDIPGTAQNSKKKYYERGRAPM